MINPIKLKDFDYCVKCKTEHSLECYDIYDRPIGYTRYMRLIDSGEKVYNNKSLSYIKCKKCQFKYDLDWTHTTKYPRPLIQGQILSIYKHR